jgi:hypothetical protein
LRRMFGVVGFGRVGAVPFLRVGSVLLRFSMLFFSLVGLAKLYAATCLLYSLEPYVAILI